MLINAGDPPSSADLVKKCEKKEKRGDLNIVVYWYT
jgi:hypothetical protein